MLDRHKFEYLAVDNNAAAVPEQRRLGRTVYYGDATNPEFLKSCGLMEAAAVIVTIGEAKGIDEIVAEVRASDETCRSCRAPVTQSTRGISIRSASPTPFPRPLKQVCYCPKLP